MIVSNYDHYWSVFTEKISIKCCRSRKPVAIIKVEEQRPKEEKEAEATPGTDNCGRVAKQWKHSQ